MRPALVLAAAAVVFSFSSTSAASASLSCSSKCPSSVSFVAVPGSDDLPPPQDGGDGGYCHGDAGGAGQTAAEALASVAREDFYSCYVVAYS